MKTNKTQQLHKELYIYQHQLKLQLPSIINKVAPEQVEFFSKLFNNNKPTNVQELYSQSLLRLDPHISRQDPSLDIKVIKINELIHNYFVTYIDKLKSILTMEKEIKLNKDMESLQVSQESTQIQYEENRIEMESLSIEDLCEQIKKKYYREQQTPNFDACVCGNQMQYKGYIQCQLCENYFHIQCLDKSYEETIKYYTCPRCTLYNMDLFCEVISVIVPPSFFRKISINNNKIVKFKAESELIDIRCIRLDSPLNSQEITWPDIGELTLNGKRILEFQPLPLQSCQHKRKDEKITASVDIGEEYQLKIMEQIPGMEQKKKLRIVTEQLHYFGVYRTKCYTAKQLIEYLIENPKNWMSLEQCQDFIILTMNKNLTEGVQIESCNISLLCCLSSLLINTPARGTYCEHIQCFSLENYLLMQDLTIPRKWRCPICKVKIFKIQIDSFQFAILNTIKQLNLQERVTEVAFDRRGLILDDLLSKSIEFQTLPLKTKQKNNRILQLEQLSNPRVLMLNQTVQNETTKRYNNSILIE